MSTNGTATAQTATITDTIADTSTETISAAAVPAPEQLSLLPTPSIPLQFRLDERTRRAGLAHVEVLRAQIAAQAAARKLSPAGTRSIRRPNRPSGRQSSPQIAA